MWTDTTIRKLMYSHNCYLNGLKWLTHLSNFGCWSILGLVLIKLSSTATSSEMSPLLPRHLHVTTVLQQLHIPLLGSCYTMNSYICFDCQPYSCFWDIWDHTLYSIVSWRTGEEESGVFSIIHIADPAAESVSSIWSRSQSVQFGTEL